MASYTTGSSCGVMEELNCHGFSLTTEDAKLCGPAH